MSLDALVPARPRFRTSAAVLSPIEQACAARLGWATAERIGESEAGRPLVAVRLGRGPRRASLVAGAHADEPVGPETLRTLVLAGLQTPEVLGDLLDRWTLCIVPHLNPDGEARNRRWMAAWPDLGAFLRTRMREAPGRDVEFGYPDLRAENRHVAAFLERHGPFNLHMSLHGMAFSEGALLLIERHWSFRTALLRDGFRAAAERAGLALHDHNRLGEKGFFYLGPGFTTTPEGEAMRTFFRSRSQDDVAAGFRLSSMEYVRGLGGDPLCAVTELPLFVVHNPEPEPGVPAAYLRLREALPALTERAEAGAELFSGDGWSDDVAQGLPEVRPLPLPTAMRVQLAAIRHALQQVEAAEHDGGARGGTRGGAGG